MAVAVRPPRATTASTPKSHRLDVRECADLMGTSDSPSASGTVYTGQCELRFTVS
jgi:hypothetical protein